MEILPQLGQVDAIVTDPPYGCGVKYGEHYDDSRKDYWDWFRGVVSAMRGACPHVLFTHRVTALKELDGYDWISVWHKPGSFGARVGNSYVLPHWEPIFMYGIHQSGTKSDYMADVISMNPEKAMNGTKGIGRDKWLKDGFVFHPCPKPCGLYERLINCSTHRQDLVADPFMGSGTTGVACANLGRKFIGIEIEKKYFDIACERIEAAYAQGRLFA